MVYVLSLIQIFACGSCVIMHQCSNALISYLSILSSNVELGGTQISPHHPLHRTDRDLIKISWVKGPVNYSFETMTQALVATPGHLVTFVLKLNLLFRDISLVFLNLVLISERKYFAKNQNKGV